MRDRLFARFKEISEEDLRRRMEEKKPVMVTFFYKGLQEVEVPIYIEELVREDAGTETYLYLKVKTVTKDGKEWVSGGVIVVDSGEGTMFEPTLKS